MSDLSQGLFVGEKSHSTHLWRNFLLNISLVVLLFVLGIFLGGFITNQHLIEQEQLSRARAHFFGIVTTRAWNARHEGVYVEKRGGVESNPYLEDPDITTADGRVFTKKNPALMTREISELTERSDELRFHITSLRYVNPDNAPDAFEREALLAFEQGEREIYRKEHEGDRSQFRYMAPLMAERSCLACHQDYQLGEVRGGISVSFDISQAENILQRNRLLTLLLFLLTAGSLLALIYRFTVRLSHRLFETESRLRELSMRDDLTGLYNRRHFFEVLGSEEERVSRYGHPLSCIMLDVDHFKRVNDRRGHQMGDRVLSAIAEVLEDRDRSSDLVARYGGEEFVLLLPETNCTQATGVAERLRTEVAELSFTDDQGHPFGITASFGVAEIQSEGKQRLSLLVKEADDALYAAKAAGRNCVVAVCSDASGVTPGRG